MASSPSDLDKFNANQKLPSNFPKVEEELTNG